MVKTQYPYEDENGNKHPNLIKHYSALNLKIQKVGTEDIYTSAVDPYPTTNEYIETDIPIEPDETGEKQDEISQGKEEQEE